MCVWGKIIRNKDLLCRHRLRVVVVVLSSSVSLALRVPNLAGHVVLVDRRLLQKHVQTALVLGQRVTGDFVQELLQPLSPLLDKVLVEDAVVAAERHLALPRLARQRRHHDLAIALEFVPQPFKVAVPSSDARFLHFEHWQVCPHPNLVVGVALLGRGQRCLSVYDVDLEEVGRNGVRVIKGLLLHVEPAGRLGRVVRFGHHDLTGSALLSAVGRKWTIAERRSLNSRADATLFVW